MARRRKPYEVPLASEWEANLFLGFLLSLIVAVFGIFYLLFKVGKDILDQSKVSDDLLAPRRQKSVFRILYEQIVAPSNPLPDPLSSLIKKIFQAWLWTLGLWFCFCIFIYVITTNIIFLSFNIVFLTLIIGFLTTSVFVGKYIYEYSFFVDNPQHFSTLFQEHEASLHQDHLNTVYTIRLPRGLQWDSERSIRFIEQLTYSFEPLLFRICADNTGIIWQ